jgi:hypothetical protein
MPANHRHWQERQGWTPDYFLNKARQVGPATLAALERILTAKAFLEQTYNTCLGILKLANRYGNDRLEAACRYAESAPRINYTLLHNILLSNRDQTPAPQTQEHTTPTHDNVRGPSAYQ